MKSSETMNSSSMRSFKVVRSKRLYEQIAEQVEALIKAENLLPGSKLPGERELAEMMGVSRPSIREALIALETAGYIEFRQGSGNYVRDPASRKTLSVLKLEDLGPGALEQFEARRALEPACAELAGSRATPTQVAGLKASLQRMRQLIASGRDPSEEHRTFHSQIAVASGNSIFAAAVRDLWTLRQDAMWDLLRRRVANDESHRAGLAFREKLILSLERGDSSGARNAMEEHFERISKLYFDDVEA
jgi:DNA-binding FadR family transcriptional regulator